MIIRDTYIVKRSGLLVRLHRAEFRERPSCPKTVSRFFLEGFVEIHGDWLYGGLTEISIEYANTLISESRTI